VFYFVPVQALYFRKVPKNLYVTPSRRAEHGGGTNAALLRMTDRPFGKSLAKV